MRGAEDRVHEGGGADAGVLRGAGGTSAGGGNAADGDDWNDHEALYRWGFLLTGIQETLETRLLGALGNGREVTP